MSDLDVLKEIPGYKAILKSVLKSQIHLLMEQLSEHTGEESIILTASVHDGSLSHLGSNTGKGFLEGRDEIKSQFLGYCLKTYHKKKTHEPQKPYQRTHPSPRSPAQLPTPPAKRPRVHPVILSKASPAETYNQPSDIPSDANDSVIGIGNSGVSMTDSFMSVKTEQIDDPSSDIPQHELMTESNESVPFMAADRSLPDSVHLSHTQTSSESAADIDSAQDKGDSERTDMSDLSSIKVEQVEDELEITGVEMAAGNLDNWGQGHPGYAAESDSSFDQSADQSGYKEPVPGRTRKAKRKAAADQDIYLKRMFTRVNRAGKWETIISGQPTNDVLPQQSTSGIYPVQLIKGEELSGHEQSTTDIHAERPGTGAELSGGEQSTTDIHAERPGTGAERSGREQSTIGTHAERPGTGAERSGCEQSTTVTGIHAEWPGTGAEGYVTMAQLDSILDRYDRKTELRELEEAAPVAGSANEEEQFELELEKIISLQKSPFYAVEAALSFLFTPEEIKSHSATGKKPNSTLPAKPRFDPARYNLMSKLVSKHFDVDHKDIVHKVQAVKRKFARQNVHSGQEILY